jgi:hypothetical protein
MGFLCRRSGISIAFLWEKGHSHRPGNAEGVAMLDAVYLSGGLIGFAACLAYGALCEWL